MHSGFPLICLAKMPAGVGEPVVSVNDVELLGARHLSGYDAVVVYLLVKVAWVSAGKLHAPQVVDVHIAEVGIYVVAEPVILIRVHQVADALLHVVAVNVLVHYWHAVHCHDTRVGVVFIAKRPWQAKRYLHVALGVQSFRNAEVGGGQSTEYMRRILPSKH